MPAHPRTETPTTTGGARLLLAASVTMLTHCAAFGERAASIDVDGERNGAFESDSRAAEGERSADQPVRWTARIVAVSQGRPRWLTVDRESVYWTEVGFDADGRTAGTLMRLARNEGATPIAMASGIENPQDLALDASRLYWLEGAGLACADSAVGSIGKDGTSRSAVGVVCYRGRAVRVDETHTYVLGALGEIVRRSKDGATQVELQGKDGVATSLALGPETIYFGSGGGIQQISKTANELGTKRLFAADADTVGLTTDDTHVYWASTRGTLERLEATRSGRPPQRLASGLLRPIHVALDTRWAYVASEGDGTVKRVEKMGGELEKVFSGVEEPCGLAADDVDVYVADCATGVITALRRR